MAGGDSLGPDNQKRAWAFVYALFNSRDNPDANLKTEIRIERKNWRPDRNKNSYPVLSVTATKENLIKLIKNYSDILGDLKFTGDHFSDAYNSWLADGKPLDILKDLRESKRGAKASLYIFELRLWSTLKEDNKHEFDKKWEAGKT